MALAVVVFMQIGTVARPLGDIGGTRAADWLDLLTPWAVVGAAAWVLLRCRSLTAGDRPDAVAWVLLALGGLAFAEGKGLHLAGNSIGNADPVGRTADIARLWDDAVGHWLWYLGLLVIFAAVARTLLADDGRTPLHTSPLGIALAAVTGFSLANTWIEGATPWLGLAAAAGFAAWGGAAPQPRRDAVGRLLRPGPAAPGRLGPVLVDGGPAGLPGVLRRLRLAVT